MMLLNSGHNFEAGFYRGDGSIVPVNPPRKAIRDQMGFGDRAKQEAVAVYGLEDSITGLHGGIVIH